MRDFSADHRWLSLNTATVRKQGNLVDIIDACARHGIRAIDPWRDQVAAVGLDRAARAVRDAGLELSGYCRGGVFVADAAPRAEARPAWCWWPAGCRNIRGRAAKLRRISPTRGRKWKMPSPK